MRYAGLYSLVVAVGALACSETQTDNEEIALSSAAIKSDSASVAANVTASAVSGTSAALGASSAAPACVFGTESVVVRNSAKVTSDIGSNSTVDIQAGTTAQKTRINGNLAARGSVHIGGNTIVGNINTPSSVNVEPGATTGTITHTAVESVTLSTKTVTPGSTDINLNAPSCAGASPAPGNYRYINVNQGCTLSLSAGTYNVTSLNVNAGAGLKVADGVVNVNASQSFTFGNNAVLTGVPDPSKFNVYANGSVYIQANTKFRGSVLAPNGDASISTNSTFSGCIRGKRTSVDGYAIAMQDMCNPPLNTAVSGHGNTDWHIDTANEFLFGQDMAGNSTAANFAPATWTKTHLWTPADSVSNTAHYYHDQTLIASGADTDASNGIDGNQMLFFHAGHGAPTFWNTLGDDAYESNMKLGNCADQGHLRYFWICSCETMAHGPRTCSNTSLSYGCPDKFDGSADSVDMRNAYQRWGNVLNNGYLRMACGGSSDMWCHETQMNAIWSNYNVSHYDVADTWQYGARSNDPSSEVAPICMTRGGADVTKTPLYDTTFTNEPNLGGDYMWLQYLTNFTKSASSSAARAATSGASSSAYESLGELPVLVVGAEATAKAASRSASAVSGDLEDTGEFYVSKAKASSGAPQKRIAKASGAEFFEGQSKHDKASLAEGDYVKLAQQFVKDANWEEEGATVAEGTKTMVERATLDGKRLERIQKNVRVTIRRKVSVNGVEVPVIGQGGEIAVLMNNDGSVAKASKTWRAVSSGTSVALKPFAQAELEARGQLDNPEAYALIDWKWGYKEEAGNVAQKEMRVVIRFNYARVMSSAAGTEAKAARTVEVLAQE